MPRLEDRITRDRLLLTPDDKSVYGVHLTPFRSTTGKEPPDPLTISSQFRFASIGLFTRHDVASLRVSASNKTTVAHGSATGTKPRGRLYSAKVAPGRSSE